MGPLSSSNLDGTSLREVPRRRRLSLLINRWWLPRPIRNWGSSVLLSTNTPLLHGLDTSHTTVGFGPHATGIEVLSGGLFRAPS
jgi:hypothetical protein